MPLTTSRVDASPVLRTTDGDSALAILADDVGLRGEAVADGRDIANVSGGAAHRLDGHDHSIPRTVLVSPLSSTSYSNWPILAVPPGRITFCEIEWH